MFVNDYEIDVLAFAAFGLGSQALLAAYFAARRWSPQTAQRFGWIAYAFALLGLPLGGWLLVGEGSQTLGIGPILLGLWAALGVVVDLWLQVEWRVPIRLSVFIPYVALYFFGQMFLWWPLWDLSRVAWACFLVLFVVNTLLNLRGHFGHDGSGLDS